MKVVTIEVPELGNRCHLVHDGARALVVDPPCDLAPIERAAEDAGVDIAAVADTHVHSDYLSGAAVLAARHRVPYLLSAEERVEVDRLPVQGGDVVPVGALEVQVLDTPGHTLHHQSYVVRHGDLERPALFSGGSLLHGTVGRTDLVDPLLARLLGRAQWQSAQHQAVLPSATSLHPTHGFGSLCSAMAVAPDEDAGTVGHERRTNAALTTPRDEYVEALVEGFGPVPSYYRHLARLNRKAPDTRAGATVPVADVDEVAERAQRGEWVLDVRPRAAYAEAHLPGSVGIERGDSFATWAGWVTPWGADLTLVADRHQDLDTAVHDLGQIGIGVGRVHLLGPTADWPAAATVRRVGLARVRLVAARPRPRCPARPRARRRPPAGGSPRPAARAVARGGPTARRADLAVLPIRVQGHRRRGRAGQVRPRGRGRRRRLVARRVRRSRHRSSRLRRTDTPALEASVCPGAALGTGSRPCPGRRTTAPPVVVRPRRVGRVSASLGQPPATAGITEIWVPSGVGVFRLSRKRTSSLPTYTLTNRRSWPPSSRMRPLMPAYVESRSSSTAARSAPSADTSDSPPV